MCLILCVLMSTFTKAHDCPHKDLDICMLTLNMPVFDNGFFFSDSFDSKSIFLNEQEKKKATMLPSNLVWLTFAQRGVTNVE